MTKLLVAAIIGAPNAGKSTLLNQILGSKISIVTPKVQTTRISVRGIYVEDKNQIVFIDTPGIFVDSKRKLEKKIVKSAWVGASAADKNIVLVDANRNLTQDLEFIIESLKNENKKAILVLNKTDIADKEKLLLLAQELYEKDIFEKVFMISAKKGDGVRDLIEYLKDQSFESDWLYPEDQVADVSMKFIAAEITREKLFLSLDQELPYDIAVETEKWEEYDNGSVKINQVIYTGSDSHKKIILGKNGSMIKNIGQRSRAELEKNLGQKVHLFLFVKVKSNWVENQDLFSYE